MSNERKVNPFFLTVPLLLIVPLVWVFASSFGNNPRAVPAVLVGQGAPAFELTDVDGTTFRLADHAGSPVVLNFWSTWCVPCKVEHPLLMKAPAAYPDVTFAGVVYSDAEHKVRAYLSREGKNYPQLLDPGGRVAIDFGVAGVPETYFVNTNGRVIYKHSGALYEALLAKYIDLARKAD